MVVLRARPTIIADHVEGTPVVTPTWSTAVHVKFGRTEGEWHRLLLDSGHPREARTWRTQSIQGARTACGLVITGYYAMREESLAGRLCTRGCFTAVEHQVAAEIVLAEERQREEAEERQRAENEELDRRIQETRARAKERIDEAARRFTTREQPAVRKPDGDDNGDG